MIPNILKTNSFSAFFSAPQSCEKHTGFETQETWAHKPPLPHHHWVALSKSHLIYVPLPPPEIAHYNIAGVHFCCEECLA